MKQQKTDIKRFGDIDDWNARDIAKAIAYNLEIEQGGKKLPRKFNMSSYVDKVLKQNKIKGNSLEVKQDMQRITSQWVVENYTVKDIQSILEVKNKDMEKQLNNDQMRVKVVDKDGKVIKSGKFLNVMMNLMGKSASFAGGAAKQLADVGKYDMYYRGKEVTVMKEETLHEGEDAIASKIVSMGGRKERVTFSKGMNNQADFNGDKAKAKKFEKWLKSNYPQFRISNNNFGTVNFKILKECLEEDWVELDEEFTLLAGLAILFGGSYIGQLIAGIIVDIMFKDKSMEATKDMATMMPGLIMSLVKSVKKYWTNKAHKKELAKLANDPEVREMVRTHIGKAGFKRGMKEAGMNLLKSKLNNATYKELRDVISKVGHENYKGVARAQMTRDKFMGEEMSPEEIRKKEEIAKSMDDSEFKKRYGKNWKAIKIATATKLAQQQKKVVDESKEVKWDVIFYNNKKTVVWASNEKEARQKIDSSERKNIKKLGPMSEGSDFGNSDWSKGLSRANKKMGSMVAKTAKGKIIPFQSKDGNEVSFGWTDAKGNKHIYKKMSGPVSKAQSDKIMDGIRKLHARESYEYKGQVFESFDEVAEEFRQHLKKYKYKQN